MPLDCIEALTEDAPPVASIIVLHGLGADGSDFVPIAEQLDLSDIGAVRFVFPHAPERAVTINAGYRMRAWYDIFELQGRSPREDDAGLRESCAQIGVLIDREIERGVASDCIVLAGFSQGCAMTLMTGLRFPQRLAGLVGMSGYLPLAASTAADASEANRATPIFLAHGTQDDIISVERGRSSRDALKALGYAPEWHEYPMPHAVCPQEVADLNGFLKRVLAR